MTPIGHATLKPEIRHTRNLFDAPQVLAGRRLVVLDEANGSGDLLCFVEASETESGGYLVDVDRRDVAAVVLTPSDARPQDPVTILLHLLNKVTPHA